MPCFLGHCFLPQSVLPAISLQVEVSGMAGDMNEKKDNKTILMPFIWNDGGGSLESGILAAVALAKMGRDVVVAFPKGGGSIKGRAQAYGLCIEELGCKEAARNIDLKGHPIKRIKNLLTLFCFFLNIVSLIKKNNPSMIYINDDSTVITVGLASKLSRKKIVWHLRRQSRGIKDFLRVWLADTIVPISSCVARRLKTRKLTDPLVNPVDLDRFIERVGTNVKPKSESTFTLLYIGRDADWKRMDWAVGAFAIIQIIFPQKNIRLLIVGGFSDESRARALNRWRNVPVEKVDFKGYVTDIVPYFQEADVLIHPAREEPLGRVFVEAASMGVPAVGFSDGGVSDVVEDGVTGLLAPPSSFLCFVRNIKKLVADDKIRTCLSKHAKSKALKEFSVEKFGESLVERIQ